MDSLFLVKLSRPCSTYLTHTFGLHIFLTWYQILVGVASNFNFFQIKFHMSKASIQFSIGDVLLIA